MIWHFSIVSIVNLSVANVLRKNRAFEAAGIEEHTVVRINKQGDIEVRRPDSWDLVGGLIGDFETRVKPSTGLDWV